MTVSYSRLPTEETPDSTSIDFSSHFTYRPDTLKHHPKYFSYATDRKDNYASIFKYTKLEDPNLKTKDEGKNL